MILRYETKVHYKAERVTVRFGYVVKIKNLWPGAIVYRGDIYKMSFPKKVFGVEFLKKQKINRKLKST